jgi:hypothetical protein
VNGFTAAQARHDNAEPPEPAEGTSRQYLGGASVLVIYDWIDDAPDVVGVVINGHEVSPDLFHADTLAGWCDAIRAELARDAAAAEQCALEF